MIFYFIETVDLEYIKEDSHSCKDGETEVELLVLEQWITEYQYSLYSVIIYDFSRKKRSEVFVKYDGNL